MTELLKTKLNAKGLETKANSVNSTFRGASELRLEELQNFIDSEEWLGNYSVPIEQIVGATHPCYIGKAWIDLFEQGRRFGSGLFFQINGAV